MRELLQQLRSCADRLSKLGNGGLDGNSDGNVLAQHARNLVDEALSRSKWVKVADGLPVVPEGEKGVYVWVWNAKGMTMPIETFMTQQVIGLAGGYTHWQYRQDDTPAPPEDL